MTRSQLPPDTVHTLIAVMHTETGNYLVSTATGQFLRPGVGEINHIGTVRIDGATGRKEEWKCPQRMVYMLADLFDRVTD